MITGSSTTIPVDYSKVYPKLNGYLIEPLLVSPPLCTLRELQDGTYTIYDLEILHQIMEIRKHMNPPQQETKKNNINLDGTRVVS